MKNIGLVIAGILIWFFMKNKELVQGWLEKIMGRSSSSESDTKVTETITRDKARNNLGMVAPNLDYMGSKIDYIRTNKKFDIVDKKKTTSSSENLINREFVSLSRTAPSGLGLSDSYRIPTKGTSTFDNWFSNQTVKSYSPIGTSFSPKFQFGI